MLIVTLEDYKLSNIDKNTLVFPKNSLDDINELNLSALYMDTYKVNIIIPYSDKLLLNLIDTTINTIFVIPDKKSIDYVLKNNLLSTFNTELFKLSSKKSVIDKINNIHNKYIHTYEIELLQKSIINNVYNLTSTLDVSNLIKEMRTKFSFTKNDFTKYEVNYEYNFKNYSIKALTDKNTNNIVYEIYRK